MSTLKKDLCHGSQRLFNRLTNSTNDTQEREKDEQGWICRSSALCLMLREAVQMWEFDLTAPAAERLLTWTNTEQPQHSPLIYFLFTYLINYALILFAYLFTYYLFLLFFCFILFHFYIFYFVLGTSSFQGVIETRLSSLVIAFFPYLEKSQV